MDDEDGIGDVMVFSKNFIGVLYNNMSVITDKSRFFSDVLFFEKYPSSSM